MKWMTRQMSPMRIRLTLRYIAWITPIAVIYGINIWSGINGSPSSPIHGALYGFAGVTLFLFLPSAFFAFVVTRWRRMQRASLMLRGIFISGAIAFLVMFMRIAWLSIHMPISFRSVDEQTVYQFSHQVWAAIVCCTVAAVLALVATLRPQQSHN